MIIIDIVHCARRLDRLMSNVRGQTPWDDEGQTTGCVYPYNKIIHLFTPRQSLLI